MSGHSWLSLCIACLMWSQRTYAKVTQTQTNNGNYSLIVVPRETKLVTISSWPSSPPPSFISLLFYWGRKTDPSLIRHVPFRGSSGKQLPLTFALWVPFSHPLRCSDWSVVCKLLSSTPSLPLTLQGYPLYILAFHREGSTPNYQKLMLK